MPAIHSAHKDKLRIENSGAWILEDESFEYWKESVISSGLWLSGNMGTGKTILTMTVIDHLDHKYGKSARGVFAYYYCSGTNPSKNSPKDLFKDILRQLVETGPGFEIFEAWQYQKNESSLTINAIIYLIQCLIDSAAQDADLLISQGEFQNLDSRRRYAIVDNIKKMVQTTIVIDALDEMDEEDQHTVIDKLKKLLEESKGLFKVFISSRPGQTIKEGASDLGWDQIEVTETMTKYDIDNWIDCEIGEGLRLKERVDEKMISEIKEILKGAAHGVYVKCLFHKTCF
jgi:Cdc6-like AAA superfamily ATPase